MSTIFRWYGHATRGIETGGNSCGFLLTTGDGKKSIWPRSSFEVILQDPEAWAQRINGETDADAVVLKPGEHIEF